MSVSAAGPDRTLSASARRHNAVSLLFLMCAAFAFCLRFFVSPQVLDLVVDYSIDAGAFYEKLHFGTYAVLLLLPFVLFTRPFVLAGDDIGKFKALLRYCGLLLLLIAYLFAFGHSGSSVFVVDTYLAAGAAGLIMLALNPSVRRALGDLTLIMLILSALLGLVEEITHHRLLPYPYVELQFRPIGLSEHPLALGALCATAVGFVAVTNWRLWVRVAAIFILLIGCAASGARFALLLTAAEILALLVFVRWPRLSPRHERQAKVLVLLSTLVGGALLVAALFAGGLLGRFSDTIFDENFYARVNIYQVFGYVDWKDIVFGMRASDLIGIVREQLHLPAIESAPVVLILLLGLPIALAFGVLVFWMLLRLLRGAPMPIWIATITFLLAALSNNTLSAKTPVVMMIVVLILAYNSKPVPTPPKTD
ncbi:MAG: hypothetical protein JWR51_4108 [Devosia sp.]|uniref:VpsF family polysaccharide biosynthesis protein n=1 Tax=Devosia sp. TaxID=1871048 RepID=UPI002618A9CE|nr:VpsF family polysaccharide biosynthesis protein [Devosia sp.]MDB5531005.1 hypothetical protein [Devosia sp.]